MLKRLKCFFTHHTWVDVYSKLSKNDAVCFSYKRRCLTCKHVQYATGLEYRTMIDMYETKPYRDGKRGERVEVTP